MSNNKQNAKESKSSSAKSSPQYVVVYNLIQNNVECEETLILDGTELAEIIAKIGLDNISGLYELGSKVKVQNFTVSVSYD